MQRQCINEAQLTSLGKFKRLQCLSLENSKKLKDGLLPHLACITSITSLNLRGCSKVRHGHKVFNQLHQTAFFRVGLSSELFNDT